MDINNKYKRGKKENMNKRDDEEKKDNKKNKEIVLNALASENLLRPLKFPFAKSRLSKSIKDVSAGKFPVVLKLVSKELIHKSDINAVRIVHDKSSLKKEYSGLMAIASKKKLSAEGILVQEYFEGAELIVGIKYDSTFGHVVLLGFGGIFAEVISDVSIKVCPVSQKDVADMIDKLKARRIIYGYRKKTLNVDFIKNLVVKTSRIPEAFPQIMELDFNPVIINEKTGIIADVRIVSRYK